MRPTATELPAVDDPVSSAYLTEVLDLVAAGHDLDVIDDLLTGSAGFTLGPSALLAPSGADDAPRAAPRDRKSVV